jgi:hypothetical protein
MARLGGVCWNVCADLADSCGVARRGTAMAMVDETVRREGAGLQRVQLLLAGNWFAPPNDNRSRLFLSNEKHSFPGTSLRAAGATKFPCRGAKRKRHAARITPASYT